MFNILPDNYIQMVKKEYRIRLLLIALLAFLVVQIFILICILPSWVNSYYKVGEIRSVTSDLTLFPYGQDTEKVLHTIEEINNRLKVINTDLKYPKAIPIVHSIISQKNQSIYIKEITYTLANESSINMRISGIASSRDALVAYKGSLEKIKLFNAIDIPISNFSKEKDIDFFISVTTP